MEISSIASCDMTACSYNMKNQCHTFAITVGAHAECDTLYYRAKRQGGIEETEGKIGACIASECKFNERLECQAGRIDVGSHEAHADCKTFEPRA
ncbi:protein of unknown function (DUF1540) [Candidatus Methanoperedens nitroreducens]|uniref:DUF1540 domain-containing protein n=1 Tax=Candidatus Methanoperedens nitratireducens TaxID=1392998 RepID=A0A062V2L4_9EURY|nr:DUF1540 domain-containing protein [Candidatus Methanoperedens nitroreducens]KCZ70848.1 protein of unknown function (DUF1540) [Candidatus Methanoperedens nitroreducens]MDJ1420703.1 DUF1540 domain-containing protein [Candidatus Methanoperedens sp.]